MKIKPRIKWGMLYFFGVPCQPQWICTSDEAIGFGNTPGEAYAEWLDKIEKNPIGRFFQRLL